MNITQTSDRVLFWGEDERGQWRKAVHKKTGGPQRALTSTRFGCAEEIAQFEFPRRFPEQNIRLRNPIWDALNPPGSQIRTHVPLFAHLRRPRFHQTFSLTI